MGAPKGQGSEDKLRKCESIVKGAIRFLASRGVRPYARALK